MVGAVPRPVHGDELGAAGLEPPAVGEPGRALQPPCEHRRADELGERHRPLAVILVVVGDEHGRDVTRVGAHLLEVIRVGRPRVDHDRRIAADDPRVGAFERVDARVGRQDADDAEHHTCSITCNGIDASSSAVGCRASNVRAIASATVPQTATSRTVTHVGQ